MRVSCFGSGQELPKELYQEMKRVGALLARRGVAIATGASGGIGMQAALEGAAESGIQTRLIGYSYGGEQPNPYVQEHVDCLKLSEGIPFDSDYGVRLAGLLTSNAFIVAGGGGPGTFLELLATINFNQKFWRPMKKVAILEIRTNSDDLWNEGLLDRLKAWGVLSEEVAVAMRVVKSAADAVEWCCGGVSE